MVKTGILPRVPDCFQRTPKRICLQGEGTILALTVDGQGIHAVTRSAGGNKLSHRVYNIRDGPFEYDVLNYFWTPSPSTLFSQPPILNLLLEVP